VLMFMLLCSILDYASIIAEKIASASI
jgi:hypothetical protein